MKIAGIMVFGLLGLLLVNVPLAAAQKWVVGWVEKVRIYPGNLVLHAKLDSGAEYSSLHAANLTQFERDGKTWARFELQDRESHTVTLERPILRLATIKRHFLQSQKRPVIKLGICLGNFYRVTEVNLVDRSGFMYPMLIGRKFMEGAVAIDPASKYTVEPNCGEQPPLE
jgi:hypothetical protein